MAGERRPNPYNTSPYSQYEVGSQNPTLQSVADLSANSFVIPPNAGEQNANAGPPRSFYRDYLQLMRDQMELQNQQSPSNPFAGMFAGLSALLNPSGGNWKPPPGGIGQEGGHPTFEAWSAQTGLDWNAWVDSVMQSYRHIYPRWYIEQFFPAPGVPEGGPPGGGTGFDPNAPEGETP